LLIPDNLATTDVDIGDWEPPRAHD